MSQFKDFPGWVGVGGMKLGIQLSSAGTELGKIFLDPDIVQIVRFLDPETAEILMFLDPEFATFHGKLSLMVG